jgi:hypothetical protein
MKIDDSHRDHIQAVMEWLEKNVRVYPTPSRISIRQIRLDSNTLRGQALLFVGDELTGEELTLRMGDAGWLTFTPPLFHSPLGAPATYGAIELTDKTKQAVAAAVQGLLPRLLPFGIDPKTKEWVTASTPLRERISDAAEFNAALDRITRPDFEWVQYVTPDGHLSINEPINETRT